MITISTVRYCFPIWPHSPTLSHHLPLFFPLRLLLPVSSIFLQTFITFSLHHFYYFSSSQSDVLQGFISFLRFAERNYFSPAPPVRHQLTCWVFLSLPQTVTLSALLMHMLQNSILKSDSNYVPLSFHPSVITWFPLASFPHKLYLYNSKYKHNQVTQPLHRWMARQKHNRGITSDSDHEINRFSFKMHHWSTANHMIIVIMIAPVIGE